MSFFRISRTSKTNGYKTGNGAYHRPFKFFRFRLCAVSPQKFCCSVASRPAGPEVRLTVCSSCPCNRNSFQCGVMSLRRLNYDRMELERRREDSQLESEGKIPCATSCLMLLKWSPALCLFHIFILICRRKTLSTNALILLR